MGEIDRRRRAVLAVEQVAQVDRLAQMRAPPVGRADQQDRLVVGGKADARHLGPVGQQADAADGGGGQDAAAIGLVVERDIARNDREIERPAGLADALDGMDQLAHDFGALGIAEIEIVGGGQRLGAGGGEVAPALRPRPACRPHRGRPRNSAG